MISKISIGAVAVLSFLLYFAVNQWFSANEARAVAVMGTIVAERNVASLKKERATWDNVRDELTEKAQKDEIRFKQLASRYNDLEAQSKDFLDLDIPDDLADLLRDSDAAALRIWLHAAERPSEAVDIAAAYSSLKNADIYRHREVCIATLNKCNDRLIKLDSVFYGEKKPD